ncbi:MAG: hypothetical protein DHS20C19_01500 [Acidimicrobiales bacterium]|nr:MAG: hypothetical protein DHS20C19_01500 [Acidimicrobiales bacterium]
MDNELWVELIGYVASGLIVVSITQKSILRLRLLGLAGGLTFLVYSLIIEAYPIAAVNVIASIIHLWYLRKLVRRKDEVFRVLNVAPDSRYLNDFLDFYRHEIQGHFQPEFEYVATPDVVTAFVLRDMVPAGLLIGERRPDDTFEVQLDFVIPQYRDFKIGAYVYSRESTLFGDQPPSSVWATASNKDHAGYLRRMGFAQCRDDAERYEIHLN